MSTFPLYPTQFCIVAGPLTRLQPGSPPSWTGITPFLSVPANLWFTDPTARNLYFAANPGALVDGVICVVGDLFNVNTFLLTAWSAATQTWSDVTANYAPAEGAS